METNRHFIKAHRGETFTIDKVLQNKDGSPYIISNELQNPYLLISVTGSQYDNSKTFYRNYWLNLENFPRFTRTTPVNSNEINGWHKNVTFPSTQVVVLELFNTFMTCLHGGITDSRNGVGGTWTWNSNLSISDFALLNGVIYNFKFVSNNVKFTTINVTINDNILKLYYDDVLVMTMDNGVTVWESEKYKTIKVSIISDALTINIDGTLYSIGPEFAVIKYGNEYLYWDNGWKNYECRFIKTFFSYDTKDWSPKTYYYSMQIAYGTDNREQLEALADYYNIEYSKDASKSYYKNNKELYQELINLGYIFPANYDPYRPLWSISTISLLPTSELSISNYAQGGVY